MFLVQFALSPLRHIYSEFNEITNNVDSLAKQGASYPINKPYKSHPLI